MPEKIALSGRFAIRAAKKATEVASNPTAKKIKSAKQADKFKEYAAKKFARQNTWQRIVAGQKLTNKTWRERIKGMPTFREMKYQLLGFKKQASTFFQMDAFAGKQTFPSNLDQRTKAFPKAKSISTPTSKAIPTPVTTVTGAMNKSGI